MVKSAKPGGLSRRLAAYCAGTRGRRLPAAAREKAKLHLLDTLAAIVSGADMAPGRRALDYVRGQGGKREALVIGSRFRTTAVNAALANGVSAHADETDDSHPGSLTHPGCAVVPAALAMAEREGASGLDLLKAVALGYDFCARTARACGGFKMIQRGLDSHAFGGTLGATAAAGALAVRDATRMSHILSYGAEQASGLAILFRDRDHIEKAFVFAGMPARDGVAAATMVQAGMTGIADPFDGPPSFFSAFGAADPARDFRDLGRVYEVTRTNIKRWSVGSPAQAALDSTEALLRDHGFAAKDVRAITIHLPALSARVVDRRDMPDINVQYLVALMIVDGTVTFAASHDHARMKDPAIRALTARTALVASDMLERARTPRQAMVEVALADGRRLKHRTRAVRGTTDNPMTAAEIEAKALDLMAPSLGSVKARGVIRAVRALDKARSLDRLIADLRRD